MGKYHNVLYIALKIAWDFGVTNSDVVKDLLCTGTNLNFFLLSFPFCSLGSWCRRGFSGYTYIFRTMQHAVIINIKINALGVVCERTKVPAGLV